MGFGFEKASQKVRFFCYWVQLGTSAWAGVWGGCNGLSLCRAALLFCCCLVPLGWALVGCCSTAMSSSTKLSWGSFCSFSSCALFPSWQCIPTLQLDIPLAREFFVCHLCALWYGKSLRWEHSFPSSSFWRESPAGDLHVVRSKTRAWYEARGQGCYKSWGWGEHQAVNILVNSIQYVMEKSMHSSLPALPSTVAQGAFYPALQGHGSQHCCEVVPGSEGTMCTYRSRYPLAFLDWWLQLTGWDALSSPTPSTERQNSQEGCEQSGPVMSSQLIDYWKYNWILCLGEI